MKHIIAFALLLTAFALNAAAVPPGTSPNYKPFMPSELEKVVEPIALYPDVLIIQMLPAATFPDQLVDAALFLESEKDTSQIANQPWDPSVKAIANYPSVLMSMIGDPDRTTKLADAFLNQHAEMNRAIQRLRIKAQAAGNLKSNEKQDIVEEKTNSGDTIIQIMPSDPQIVYVPAETPTTVYTSYSPSYSNEYAPAATLGLGLLVGYAIGSSNNDDDNHYYYGGGSYWHGDDHYDDWMDARNDRWDDVNDRANDRQDFRQDLRTDKKDFRQDQFEKMSPEQRSKWANEKKGKWDAQGKQTARKQQMEAKRSQVRNMSPEQRRQVGQQTSNNWKSQASNRKSEWNSKTPEQRQAFSQEKRSSIESRQARNSGSSFGDKSYGGANSAKYAEARSRASYGGSGSKSWGGGGSAFSNMSSARQTSAYSQRGSVSRGSMGGGSFRGGGGGGRGGGGRGRR